MIGQLLEMMGTLGVNSRCFGFLYEPKIPKVLLEQKEQ